ncbi:MAG: hypothetical protein ACYDA1_09310 [Vulcanimicrobiaceae bacterium]
MVYAWLLSALFVIGSAIVIFAPQVAKWNASITDALPRFMRNIYGTSFFGQSYGSPFWVVYNRVGGVVIAFSAGIGLCLLYVMGTSNH